MKDKYTGQEGDPWVMRSLDTKLYECPIYARTTKRQLPELKEALRALIDDFNLECIGKSRRSMQEEIDGLKGQLKVCDRVTDNLRKELWDLRESSYSSQVRLGDALKELKESKEEIDSLKDHLNGRDDTIDRLRKDLKGLRDAHYALQIRLGDTQEDLKESREEIDSLKEENAKLRDGREFAEKVRMEWKVNGLTVNLNKLKSTYSALRAKHGEAQEELRKAKEESNNLLDHLKGRDSVIDRLRQDLRALSGVKVQLEAAQTRNGRCWKTIGELRKELNTLREVKAHLEIAEDWNTKYRETISGQTTTIAELLAILDEAN
jgi:septal ring factor EnvC (AmiA/AmiB activator)